MAENKKADPIPECLRPMTSEQLAAYKPLTEEEIKAALAEGYRQRKLAEQSLVGAGDVESEVSMMGGPDYDSKCRHCGVRRSQHHICSSCVCSTCPQKPGGGDECPVGFEPEERCHSDSDGDCYWENCPQKIKHETTCPLYREPVES